MEKEPPIMNPLEVEQTAVVVDIGYSVVNAVVKEITAYGPDPASTAIAGSGITLAVVMLSASVDPTLLLYVKHGIDIAIKENAVQDLAATLKRKE